MKVKKEKRGRDKGENETVVKRKCVNRVSLDAFNTVSQGNISECDSECGSVDESVKWSIALVNNDIYVHPSFVVEVVGVGEMSNSGWEFGSECGSVDVSGVLVVHDAGEAVLSVVTVRCDGVLPESGCGGTAVLFFTKKRNFACVEEQEDMIYEGALVRAPPCP